MKLHYTIAIMLGLFMSCAQNIASMGLGGQALPGGQQLVRGTAGDIKTHGEKRKPETTPADEPAVKRPKIELTQDAEQAADTKGKEAKAETESKTEADLPTIARTEFLAAASSDDAETLKSMLFNINAKDPQGKTALIWAAINGNKDLVHRLIKNSATLDAQDNDGFTALMQAIENNHTPVAEYLILAGANVNKQDRRGFTALMRAVKKNNSKLVKLLLKAKANPMLKNAQGKTALELIPAITKDLTKEEAAAIQTLTDFIKPVADAWHTRGQQLIQAFGTKNTELARTLLQQGADVNAKDQGDATALMVASQLGCDSLVTLLLAAGADVNAQQDEGATALMFASKCGHATIAKKLIKAGADVNAKTKRGTTALASAIAKGHIPLVKILIKAGAQINAHTDQTATPLIIASVNGRMSIVQLLLKKGADITLKNKYGKTAYERAIETNHPEIAALIQAQEKMNNDLLNAVGSNDLKKARELLQQGANPNWAYLNEPLLHVAIMNAPDHENGLDMVQLLLQAGADANLPADEEYDSFTPLMKAAFHNVPQTIPLLLGHGANVNAQQLGAGDTALHFAATLGNTHIVRMLLEAGADATIRNTEGASAYDAAVSRKRPEIAALIQDYKKKQQATASQESKKTAAGAGAGSESGSGN